MSVPSWPAVWDAVLQIAATALPNVQIVDGEIGEYLGFDYFQIVDVDGEDSPATVGQPLRMNESYSLECLVRSYAGDVNPADRRAKAAAMYTAIRDAIQTDPSLGGVINGRAYCTRYRGRVGRTEKGGSAAEIDFNVNVTNQTITAT